MLLPAALVATCVLISASPAEAKRAVGLGVGAGIAVPTIEDVSTNPTWAFGFYTDIPLISTFHITPSTLVYRIERDNGKKESATDVSINFKFMIPIGRVDIFVGVTGGVTSTDVLRPHVGALAGVSVNLVSNLDVFVNAGYKAILTGDEQIHEIQIFAGPLIRFEY